MRAHLSRDASPSVAVSSSSLHSMTSGLTLGGGKGKKGKSDRTRPYTPRAMHGIAQQRPSTPSSPCLLTRLRAPAVPLSACFAPLQGQEVNPAHQSPPHHLLLRNLHHQLTGAVLLCCPVSACRGAAGGKKGKQAEEGDGALGNGGSGLDAFAGGAGGLHGSAAASNLSDHSVPGLPPLSASALPSSAVDPNDPFADFFKSSSSASSASKGDPLVGL